MAEFQGTNIKGILCSGVLLIVGLLLLISKQFLMEYLTTSILVLSPHSLLKSIWEKTPLPVNIDIYLFNWTNPEDLYNISVKPKFQEVGPYKCSQHLRKTNLTWNQNNTVSFRQVRSYLIDEQDPNVDLLERITTVNLLTLVAADALKDSNIFTKKLASAVINMIVPDNQLTKQAKEYIFTGISDFALDLRQTFPFIFSHIPKLEKPGLFSMRNNSVEFDGIFNAAVGVNGDFSTQAWNYNDQSPYFQGTCGSVKGTTLGEVYGYNLSKEPLSIFVPEICRYLTLDFDEEVVIKGVTGYKYSIGKSTLDNGTHIHKNKCFCNGECIPSGMLSIASCYYGLPAYISLPHFLRSDPVYQKGVEGLQPNKSQHEGYIIVEPVTGIPLIVSVALQANVLVRSFEGLDLYSNVPTTYFPLLWGRESLVLPDHMALVLKIYLNLPTILVIASVILLLLGGTLLLVKGRSSMRPKQKQVMIQWYRRATQSISLERNSDGTQGPLLEFIEYHN